MSKKIENDDDLFEYRLDYATRQKPLKESERPPTQNSCQLPSRLHRAVLGIGHRHRGGRRAGDRGRLAQRGLEFLGVFRGGGLPPLFPGLRALRIATVRRRGLALSGAVLLVSLVLFLRVVRIRRLSLLLLPFACNQPFCGRLA